MRRGSICPPRGGGSNEEGSLSAEGVGLVRDLSNVGGLSVGGPSGGGVSLWGRLRLPRCLRYSSQMRKSL